MGAANHRVKGGLDGYDGVIRRDEEESVEMQDLPLSESVVCVPKGDVKLATRDVPGTVVGRDRRDPVVYEDLGIDRIS